MSRTSKSKNQSPIEQVTLTMSRDQAMVVEHACELYARLKIGQFHHITEQMLDYGEKDREDGLKSWCERRDIANDILKAAALVIYGRNPYGYPDVSKDKLHNRAWDVYQVLRYTRCWHDNPEGNFWSVCYDTPMSLIDEPLPECTVTTGDTVTNSKQSYKCSTNS